MRVSKIEKFFCFLLVKIVYKFRPQLGTKIQYSYLKRYGVKFAGFPNFIAGDVWIDGTDYGLVHMGVGVTLSSQVTVLTHDWAMHTVAKALNIKTDAVLGRVEPVSIGDNTFIGLGSILMPGCIVGKGCIVGAGSVVRGSVPDFCIYVGNPGKVIGDVRDYLERQGIGKVFERRERSV